MVVGDVFETKGGTSCVILKYTNSRDIDVEFLDGNYFRTKVSAGNLRKGEVKNPYNRNIYGVGYIGSGDFRARNGRVKTKEYSVWENLMQRCYSEKFLENNPAYKGCSVHPKWHNFQNFAEWYTSQEFYGEGYHLDKDLLHRGNKVYSEDTCCLIPRAINNAIVGMFKSGGVRFEEEYSKYRSYISCNGLQKHLGYFSTESDAIGAYRDAKTKYLKSLAETWKNKIDDRVYNSLLGEW